MYTLTSEFLEVSILDPLADQERFGTRYCTGGYIFQIMDRRHGALLSGPTYPDSFNWFDGQGIPDAFNLSPLSEPTPGPNPRLGGRARRPLPRPPRRAVGGPPATRPPHAR